MLIKTFGYRYSHPTTLGADVVFDARCLREDPAEKASLGPLTGQDPDVRDYLSNLEDVQKFVDAAVWAVNSGLPVVAIGCHSGRHRSVYIAEELAKEAKGMGILCEVEHLDMLRQPTEDLAPDVI